MMKKVEFMKTMEQYLSKLEEKDREEVLYDYEEHFQNGLADGKTEADIIRALGDPQMIAKQYIASESIKKAQNHNSFGNIANAVLATIGLGFFNLIVVLGPFLAVLGILFAFYFSSILISVISITAGVAALLQPVFPEFIRIDLHPVPACFLSIGFACFGALWLIGNWQLTKLLYQGTLRYLKWNVDIVARRSNP
jgi:uncharacterized membrane protein